MNKKRQRQKKGLPVSAFEKKIPVENKVSPLPKVSKSSKVFPSSETVYPTSETL